jgi:nucleotide-binding universal stress UspA family protein
MIKKILVPTDYSRASLNALDFAVTIAASNNACLQILHVNDTMYAGEDAPEMARPSVIRDAMAGNIQNKYGIKTEIIFTEGIVGHAIVKTVFENKIDLVIMGSHGDAGGRDFFIGSNAYYTIKRAACPVLLIPEENKSIEFCKILLPVRPALFSSKLFDFICELTRHNTQKCILQILGIAPGANKDNITTLSKTVQEAKKHYNVNKFDIALSNGKGNDIAKYVLQKSDAINADLVVISQGLDLASNPLFLGPFSQRIINHAKIPVLSLLRTSQN